MRKLILGVAGLLVVVFFASLRSTDQVIALVPATEVKSSQYCDGDVLRIAFTWRASVNWDEAWVDLSLVDNGFVRGTYVGKSQGSGFRLVDDAGVWLGTYAGLIQWPGIKQAATHYWRVNVRYGDKWHPSPTQTFLSITCPGGAPDPLSVPPPRPSLTTPSLTLAGGDLELRLDRLEKAVFGLGRPVIFGPSLDSRIDSLESQVAVLQKALFGHKRPSTYGPSLEFRVADLESCLDNLYIGGYRACY